MKSMARYLAPVAFCTLGACASTNAVPRELADARAAYQEAKSGPAAELAPAQLYRAGEALKQAERAYRENEESKRGRDLAYIAQRKSELAKADATMEMANRQRAEADRSVEQARLQGYNMTKEQLEQAQQQLRNMEHSQEKAQTQAELDRTREQLAAAERQTQELTNKLTALEGAKKDERGVVITVPGNVIFAPGKAELLPSATKQLTEVAQALAGTRGEQIVVEGHTDSRGSAELNRGLSEARAQAVLEFLSSHGVPMERLRAVGFGEAQPIASNDNNTGRALNRRVEIVVQPQAAAQR